MQDRGVEIRVARRVAAGAGIDLPDAARAVDEDLVKAAPVGLILGLVAQMPLAENAGGVAGGLEHLRQRGGLQREPLALEDRVGDAVLELVPAGHQRAARRRARGADMEVREPHALGMQLVEVGRLEHGIAMRGDVAVALVVGEDEDDVGPFASDGRGHLRRDRRRRGQRLAKPAARRRG